MSIDWKIEVFQSLPTTQDLAIARAENNAPEGTVIQSMIQTNGRGRHGNPWVSSMGNLYMSFVLRPLCRPDLAGQISFVAALALSSAMDGYLDSAHKKTLKWPNDILINGQKCAGILLESRMSDDGMIETLIIGMGVNIHTPPADRIGLQSVAGQGVHLAVHRFRDDVLAQFAAYYDGWKTTGFEPIRRDWLAQAHGLNHKLTARLPDREVKGIFRDLAPDGALILELEGKTVAIRAGEVYFGT